MSPRKLVRSQSPTTFCFRRTCRRLGAGKSCAACSRTSPKVAPSATRLRWRTPQWLRNSGINTRRRRLRRRRRGGEGAAKGGECNDPDQCDDHRTAHAPPTDRVNDEELDLDEVRGKENADRH